MEIDVKSAKEYLCVLDDICESLRLHEKTFRKININTFRVVFNYDFESHVQRAHLVFSIHDSSGEVSFYRTATDLREWENVDDINIKKAVIAIKFLAKMMQKLSNPCSFSAMSEKIEGNSKKISSCMFHSGWIQIEKNYALILKNILLSNEVHSFIKIANNYDELNQSFSTKEISKEKSKTKI